MNTAIFIMSCDKTRDVLLHFIKGFNIYWGDNSLPIFLGTNDELLPDDFNNVTLLSVPKSSWKQETIEQISLLKKINPSITHVLVMLDDFILNSKVDNPILLNLINSCELESLKYVRLKRIEEGFIRTILYLFFTPHKNTLPKIFKIRKSHPYYSSLQIALWDINYLNSCVHKAENIWHFELQKTSEFDHFSVINNIFNYRHIVEKGKWEPYSYKYCLKYINYFNENNREFNPSKIENKIVNCIKRIKFLFFGYLFSNHK